MTRASTARAVLRATAILIAFAGLADPVVSINRVPRPAVTIVTAVAGDDAGSRAALAKSIRGDAELTERLPAGVRLPCVQDRPCIVIADGSVEFDLPSDRHAMTSLVRVLPRGGPNVAVSSVEVGARQHSAAAGSIRVHLTGIAVNGRKTDVRVMDGAVVVGSATHAWSADGVVSIDVAWWPIADGVRVLRIEAIAADDEVSTADNGVEAAVTVHGDRVRVLFNEPRPSWTSTFVRRALEDDPRFAVESRARLGPLLTAGTPAARLDTAALQSAGVVIVGAPDALGPSEVALLDRYVRVRGGTLLLLPDRAPAGAASSLFPGIWTEHLTAVAEEVGPLKATEILRRSNTEVTDVVLGASSGMPAIVMSPAGNGRVLVSGAMDAWRHRGTNGNGFDRFFRGVLAELGQPRGELTIDMPASLVTAGSTVPFQVRSRRMQPAATETILATVLCGGGATGTVRVWPTGEPGGYAGEFPAATVGTCRLDVSVADGPSSSAGVAVVTAPRRDRAAALLSLERLAVATGGVAVVAGEEQQVGDRIRAQERPAAARTVVRPMQSPWWILPFAICLAGEWWLRRRDGLR